MDNKTVGRNRDDDEKRRIMIEVREKEAKEREIQALRDQFAMNALTGMLANQQYDAPRRNRSDKFAEDAYLFADAMLKARG